MSADVVSLHGYRRNHEPIRKCGCDPGQNWVCYPHRLVDLAARIEDYKGDVERFRFVDLGMFNRLTEDVLTVIDSITDDCEPGERPGERDAL